MKFNFKMAAIPLLALVAAGCGGRRDPARGPVANADGGDAQRLVAVLDYVGGDYALAVKDGAVVSAAEYDEQVKFVSEARSMAASLLGPAAPAGDPLLSALAGVEAKVQAREPADAVGQACRSAKEEVIARFGLRTMPAERPSLARAEDLYAQSCVVCHGPRGDGDTERAQLLDPRPASFRDPARLSTLSPYRVYNALTFGVRGTAMASFDALSPADRWSLAFYVFRLGHEGQPGRGPVAMTLADQAGRSDREIVEVLKTEGHPDPAQALVHVRRDAAFQEPPAGVGIDRTRRMLRQAVAAAADGRWTVADRQVLDAYLQGFEPLEPRLRARDAAGTAAVEAAFRDLRSALARQEAGDVRARQVALDARLLSLAEGRRAAVPFVASFVIYFREGLEAALLVGALLAGVRRLGRPDARAWVHAGWLAALPAGLFTWWLSERVVALAAHQRELLEAATALLAAAVLFSMSFWMISKVEAKRWTGYLRRGLESSLSRRNLYLLAGLAFLAVYREAAETVLFTQALLLESPGARGQVWGGAAVGLLAVVAAAVVMGASVLRLPLGPFFAVSSAILCALAISFAGSGIYKLVAGGYVPPRPVRFPEVRWMGIHPDLTVLLVQLCIVAVIVTAAVLTLRRRPLEAPHGGQGGS
jgi:high-affinity iron transporter